MKIAITSGYFSPVSPGHIECFRLSKELADELWVIVNSDHQEILKRNLPPFQPAKDRIEIVSAIRYVDRVVLSIDENSTVSKTLEKLALEAFAEGKEIVWCKGGDRFKGNTPEKVVCDKFGIEFRDGLGAKTHNSSEYLKNYFDATYESGLRAAKPG